MSVIASEHWLDVLLHALARLAPPETFFSFGFNLRALLALILVSLTCGAVGSLVVGGRMAFFSDALAHCAFASVSIGFVLFAIFLAGTRPDEEFWDWVTPVMLILGMLVGYGIAFVRQSTGLASDTVIGVFFAAAIGLAATLRKIIFDWNKDRRVFTLEDFLFGDPLLVQASDLVHLGVLAIVTGGVLVLIHNHLLLSTFNPSLALSRRVPIQLASYAFIMLLAVVVNLCVRTVGVLLINALLVVPAATAANVARNLRQLFWLTMLLCLGSCIAGQMLSWECESRWELRLGIPGTIILVSVGMFVLSALLRPILEARRRSIPPWLPDPGLAPASAPADNASSPPA